MAVVFLITQSIWPFRNIRRNTQILFSWLYYWTTRFSICIQNKNDFQRLVCYLDDFI